MRRSGVVRVALGVVAVVLLAAGVLVVAGLLQPRPMVLLAGDSITELSAGVLAGSLDGTFGLGGHDVAVVARSGATAGEMAPEVVTVAPFGPEQVIINLGTNDAVRTGTTAEGLAEIERMAAAFPDARCVHLVTLSQSMVTFEDPVGPGERATAMNQGIIELAEREGYGLIRWDQLVAEGIAQGQPLTLDSIHPDEEGERRLADAYAAAVASC